MNWLDVFILAFVEGVTEFLPISSTGHLIIASHFMGISEDQFVKNFNIIIQFGAILSVLVLYWQKFFSSVEFYKKLFIAFLPAAVIGLLVKSKIDILLDSVVIVAWSLVLGGLVFLATDKLFKKAGQETIETLSLKKYFYLGVIQCLAFIPGVSRSGATIVAGMFLGLSKKEAAEFSFFLGVPTIAAASLYKFKSILPTITSDQIGFLAVGFMMAFVFAALAIKVFIKVVSQYGFNMFGVYRILLGGVILILFYGDKFQ
jgi:undecaprenyl-diphosphatase